MRSVIRNQNIYADTVKDLKAKVAAFRTLFDRDPIIVAKGTFRAQDGEAVFFDYSAGLVEKVDHVYVTCAVDGAMTKIAPDGSAGYFEIR